MKNNMYLWILIAVAVIAVLVFLTINSNKNNMPTNSQIGSAQNTPPVVAPATTPATSPTSTGTTVRVAKAGDTISVNYTGRLANGTVFDSNVDPKFGHVTPFTFLLGSGQVIKGWDEGVAGMKVGEKKTLVISPDKGYGAGGYPPIIPPNATLTFDVQLLAIK